MIRINIDYNNYLPQEVLFFIKLAPRIHRKRITHILGISILDIVHRVIHNKDYLDRIELQDKDLYACILTALQETDKEPDLSKRVLDLYLSSSISYGLANPKYE